jgi:hypothetical protein
MTISCVAKSNCIAVGFSHGLVIGNSAQKERHKAALRAEFLARMNSYCMVPA